MPLRNSCKWEIFCVALVFIYILDPYNTCAFKGMIKHLSIARHTQIFKKFPVGAREREEPHGFTIFIYLIIKKRSKCCPGEFCGGIGYALQHYLHIHIFRNALANRIYYLQVA